MKLWWRHVVVGTKYSWLHGDPRGFRDRRHRIHSSGGYKAPPPAGEYAGLFRHRWENSGEPVDLELEIRVFACRAFVQKWQSLGYRIIACSVRLRHLHAVVEGPTDYGELKRLVGKCKQRASHAVRHLLAGTIWAANGGFKPVRGPGHLRNSYKCVRTRQESGTVAPTRTGSPMSLSASSSCEADGNPRRVYCPPSRRLRVYPKTRP